MTRRRLSMKDKLEILIRQAVCPLCNERLGKLDGIDFDHIHPLALGGSDDDLTNFQAVHRDTCHRIKTSGTKATSAGSDIHMIAKAKRLARKNADFLRLVSSDDTPPEKPKSKWPSRPFPKRAKK